MMQPIDSDTLKIIFEMTSCWPLSMINAQGDFIVDRSLIGATWFRLDDVASKAELQYKVISILSRGACMSEVWRTRKQNDEYQSYVRNGMNKYLGTNFTQQDCYMIYSCIGNYANRNLAHKFIDSGFDMNVLRNAEEGKQ